jgi:hypothetical protein
MSFRVAKCYSKQIFMDRSRTKARSDAVPYHEYLIRVLVFNTPHYLALEELIGCIHKPRMLHLFPQVSFSCYVESSNTHQPTIICRKAPSQ